MVSLFERAGESGKEMPMLDPMAPKLREGAKAAVFSEELDSAPAFSKRVSDTLNSFYEEVARALVKSIS